MMQTSTTAASATSMMMPMTTASAPNGNDAHSCSKCPITIIKIIIASTHK